MDRPRRGPVFRRSDLYLVPLALLISAIAFTNLTVWLRGAPFAVETDLILIAFGLYAVFGRFFHDARLRSGLLYAVSDRRVILLKTRWRRRLQSREIAFLPILAVDREDGGRGSLRFDVEDNECNPYFRNSYWTWTPSGENRLGFEEIEHPQLVCDLIARQSDRCRRELFESAAGDPLFHR